MWTWQVSSYNVWKRIYPIIYHPLTEYKSLAIMQIKREEINQNWGMILHKAWWRGKEEEAGSVLEFHNEAEWKQSAGL